MSDPAAYRARTERLVALLSFLRDHRPPEIPSADPLPDHLVVARGLALAVAYRAVEAIARDDYA